MTRAMELGTMKHDVAFACVERELGRDQPVSTTLPRIRRYATDPGGEHLVGREVIRLILYLPLDHHEIANPLTHALNLYVDAVGAGPDVFSEYDLGVEAYPLDEEGWRRVRSKLLPRAGARYVDDIQDERVVHRYVKDQFERYVELSRGPQDISGYGFFYRSRLPWRHPPEDEQSLVSFSWPTQYLESHGVHRLRSLLLELASSLPFSSGHAGPAFYSPNPFGTSLEGIHEEAFRHPGMDVTHGTLSLGTHIDGVHWLNFLGPPVLPALGGTARLRSQLHAPGTTVHALEGERAVVSLGEWPDAGDLTLGENLPASREFSRVLRPWLLPCPREPFQDSTLTETRRWWSRFLD